MEAVLAITRAFDFAARKHIDQRRKGARGEPYLNHLAEVARLLAEATSGRDPVVVVAGLLHDVLEDTDTHPDELEREFGREVTVLVGEVTDDKRLPKLERKQLQVVMTPRKSERARLIKLADKTSNLRGIVSSPPEGWTIERRREYFLWARQVVAGCRGLNLALESSFDQAYHAGLASLNPPPGGD